MHNTTYSPVRRSVDDDRTLRKKRSWTENERESAKMYDDEKTALNIKLYDSHDSLLNVHEIEARKTQRKLMLAIAMCLSLFALELIGGWLSQSLAVMADACHMLTDVATYGVSFAAVYIGKTPPSKRMSFGYHRAEVLGALGAVLIIWTLAGTLIVEAWGRLTTHREVQVDGRVMLGLALLSFAMNAGLFFFFGHDDHHHHGHGHGHSHGHSHGHTHGLAHSHDHDDDDDHDDAHDDNGKDGKTLNINIRAAMLHALGDLVCSCSVILSSILIIVDPAWSFVDAISTMFFSCVVVSTTFRIIRDIVTSLMEAVPDHIDPDEVERTIRASSQDISEVHDLHIWSLSSEKCAMTAHVVTSHGSVSEVILVKAQSALRRKFQFVNMTLQIESGMEECPSLSLSQYRLSVDDIA